MEQAYENGKKLLCGNYSQYTPTGKDYFVREGRWQKIPNIGDVVYFYSTNMKRVCHVGIVIEVDKKGDTYNIKTVEGNTSSGNSFSRNGGEVAIKEYTFKIGDVGGANRINGFGRPLFSDSTCTLAELLFVAKNEVGYKEKASNKNLEDKNANIGDKNFTKYGAWYGGNGLYWCQQFVSWCAYIACKKFLQFKGTSWEKVPNGWKYKENGSYAIGAWKLIDGRYYVFDNSGLMITGWFKSGDDWYFLNKEDGAMLSSQWIKEDEHIYYYLSSSGIMSRNCYVYNKDKDLYHWVGSDGKSIEKWDTKEPDLEKYELAN